MAAQSWEAILQHRPQPPPTASKEKKLVYLATLSHAKEAAREGNSPSVGLLQAGISQKHPHYCPLCNIVFGSAQVLSDLRYVVMIYLMSRQIVLGCKCMQALMMHMFCAGTWWPSSELISTPPAAIGAKTKVTAAAGIKRTKIAAQSSQAEYAGKRASSNNF